MLLGAGALYLLWAEPGARKEASARCNWPLWSMNRHTVIIIGVIFMAGLIVGLDVAFLRDSFLLRLITNVCIVAAFALLYLLARHRL